MFPKSEPVIKAMTALVKKPPADAVFAESLLQFVLHLLP